MYRRIINLVLALITVLTSFAQDSNSPAKDSSTPVKWTYEAVRQPDNSWILRLKADIAPGWKLFSTTMKDDEPNTRVVLDSAILQKAGAVREAGSVKEVKEPLFDNIAVRFFENQASLEIPIAAVEAGSELKGAVQFMAIRGEEVIGPEEVPFRFAVDANGTVAARSSALQEQTSTFLKREAINLDKPLSDVGGTGGEDAGSKSLWSVFVLGVIGGLIGLIMPCTFPMIPFTVSFFTKKSQSRQKGIANAFTYGFFIFLIYVLLSIPFYFMDGGSADILNNISTNAWLNLVFAAIFLAFALSFFGLFEITLPGSLSSSVDQKSGIGGKGGIFFMALTLAIVSFSCTGPILGTLLVSALSQDGGAVQLTVAMAGFGLALGLPFALFALFPNWLSNLPRSGAWMNTVKIVFAFVELALMIKFLSNADLVMHWGILKREVFFLIWIVIGICTSLYLFGIIKFKHDPPPAKLTTGRKILALAFLAFALYLVPGVTKTKYANRSLVSGFPPPLSYSIYGDDHAGSSGLEPMVINDYEKALKLSKEQNRPLLIDFTGWACVNCRKMEENVWTAPGIKELIEKNFILVSLYVDDRAKLPDSEQFIYTTADGTKKEIKTVGQKYATFQTENFRNASQPLYVILSPEEQLLNRPVGYTPNPETYKNWLESGIRSKSE
ncbi:protein-disulfide reductase DsbD family protein [Flavihumibacter solisilvae]|uniref:Cytochrome C biogenesis protein n=1 Tax=Flavihumibacter solisilvae TaxID=1349421 RepID=A0A0C1KZP5_9BACT|nr:thioredoxin family protein [Flavihumibacter solisilvae]KIC92766.1 cytochrome C biogenesis protein [Flavihumibacter solisilvae]